MQPKIVTTLKGYSGVQLLADALAGLTVALVAIPLSLAIAIASGTDPAKGLITAIIVLCNATVTTAGGFFFVWWWGAELTTAVIVGFLVLLGVMFNDGILLGTYIQEQF